MSRFNHRNKWTSRDYVVRYLFVTVIIAILVAFMPRESVRTYHYQEGGLWDYATLIAEDSFPILKSVEQIQKEKDSIVYYYEPYFNLNAQVSDNMLTKWHKTFKDTLSGRVPSYFEQHITYLLMEIYDHGIVSGEDQHIIEAHHDHAVRVIKGNVSSIRNTAEVYTLKTAYERLMAIPDSTRFRRVDLLKCNLSNFLTANLFYDEEKSNQQLAELEAMVIPYIGQVIVGQKIVDRGEIISPTTFRILESMKEYMGEKEMPIADIVQTIAWQTVYTGIVVILLLLYFQQFRNDYLASKRSMMLICTLFIFPPLMVYALATHDINCYILPYCITPIFLRIFLDSRTAVTTHLMIILMCAVAVPHPADFIIIETLAGLTAIITLRELNQRSELFRAVLAVLGVSLATYISLQALNDLNLFVEEVNYEDFFCIIGSCLLLMVSYLLLIPIERIFGFTSNVTLIELSNANNPLLRQMSEQAPGTFQHSMQVANLSAAVAEKLGAKSPLVRTGALYHDIGKIRHAVFFTENQRGMNPHDRLTETQSAQIIISHVREGLALAEKYKLPKNIRDFIATHHGKSLTKYFYVQALNKAPEGMEVDPAKFTYPGPNPQTMEQAILMMCDAVEAASRSLKEITEESISDLVNKVIDDQVASGNYQSAPITFQDIEIAKEVLKDKLRIIYHTRVQYPELKK